MRKNKRSSDTFGPKFEDSEAYITVVKELDQKRAKYILRNGITPIIKSIAEPTKKLLVEVSINDCLICQKSAIDGNNIKFIGVQHIHADCLEKAITQIIIKKNVLGLKAIREFFNICPFCNQDIVTIKNVSHIVINYADRGYMIRFHAKCLEDSLI